MAPTTYYIYLSAWWIAFCASHSIFAATPVKDRIARWSGKYFRFYRLLFSLWSLVFLIFLLIYQLGKKEPILFSVDAGSFIVAFVLIIGGAMVMGLSAMRYFMPVTGLDKFTDRKSETKLLQHGIHGVIRHPLYAGTLSLVWGLFLIFPFGGNLISCLIISSYTFIGISLEEKKLSLRYGTSYDLYRSRVPMMIPSLPCWKFRSILRIFFE